MKDYDALTRTGDPNKWFKLMLKSKRLDPQDFTYGAGVSITAREWRVLRAIPYYEVPYTDAVHRRSGLPRADFDSAVDRLVDRLIVQRCHGAHAGECIYPTLRGDEVIKQGPPA